MKTLEVTEIKPVWRFLLETWREHGFRLAWSCLLIFIKMKQVSPFGTLTIAVFKDSEDTAEVKNE